MRHRNLLYALCFCLITVGTAVAVELTGTTSVNVTSDTASAAKNSAFNSARREVVARELRRYANAEQLDAALRECSNEELVNIISSVSLDGEKVSDTTYSANISFVIDSDAAREFLEKYSVQHWLPTDAPAVAVAPENVVVINASLLQPMADWAALNAVGRSVDVDIATTWVRGNNVSFTVADKEKQKFLGALRTNGWYVQISPDGYKIWK